MPTTLRRSVVLPLLLALSGGALADGMEKRASAGAGAVSGASAEPDGAALALVMDFSRIVTFDEPAKDIIFGNPEIVDGTLSDQRTMVLTPKRVGTTNLIVIGTSGREIANLTVGVAENSRRKVTVHSGDRQESFSCLGPCNPAPIAAAPK